MNDVIENDEVTALAPVATHAPQPLALQQDTSQGAVMLRMIEAVLLRPDFNVEKLNAMLDAKQRMDDEAARREFRRDFAGFRGENIIIPKTKHVDRGRAGSFEQAEYHVVADRISVALARHGFSFRHDQRFGVLKIDGSDGATTPWVWVTCFLEHRGGHAEKLELEGPPGDLSANTPVQNMQVTASYLKRQSLLAITGTATGGEDDESQMHQRKPAGEDGAGEDDGPDSALQAGHDAAMEGMTALTAWWGGLTAKQRSQWAPDFGRMRKAAALADQGAAR